MSTNIFRVNERKIASNRLPGDISPAATACATGRGVSVRTDGAAFMFHSAYTHSGRAHAARYRERRGSGRFKTTVLPVDQSI
jgi:hypothetical protein